MKKVVLLLVVAIATISCYRDNIELKMQTAKRVYPKCIILPSQKMQNSLIAIDTVNKHAYELQFGSFSGTNTRISNVDLIY